MAHERNERQQNSVTRSEIAQCARRVVDGDQALSWLPAVLKARGIDPGKGILAACSETSEDGGRLCTGTWLTASREFWDFRVSFPVAGDGGPTVELFEERSVSVFAHERGIGKSFGALAIEVLDEMLDITG